MLGILNQQKILQLKIRENSTDLLSTSTSFHQGQHKDQQLNLRRQAFNNNKPHL